MSASIVTFMFGSVVVRSAESATRFTPPCFTASTNFSGVTSTPRSTTSKPAPSSIMHTRFLPMSWRSPFTVPATTRPAGFTSVATSFGRRMASASFIARAEMSISGRK